MNKDVLNRFVSKVSSWRLQLQSKMNAKRNELEQNLKLKLVNYTNGLLRAEIIKQGKNPDKMPETKAPELTVADAIETRRPSFHTPFVPSWVRDSFKNPNKHVVRNPLPKPPPVAEAARVLSAEEFQAVMNDDEEVIHDIFEEKEVLGGDDTQWFPKEDVQRTNAIADLKAMLADINLELPEEASVQVTSGARAVPANKVRKVSKSTGKPRKLVRKFKKGIVKRVED